jgi:hypothetical protein
MMLERRLAAAERARQRDMQQLAERSTSLSSPMGGGGGLGSSDEMGDDSFTPRTVRSCNLLHYCAYGDW